MIKITTTGPDEPEAQGHYPNEQEASYLQYDCNYCTGSFYLVIPGTHQTGGAINREVLKRDPATKEIVKVGRVFPVCISCCIEIMRRS